MESLSIDLPPMLSNLLLSKESAITTVTEIPESPSDTLSPVPSQFELKTGNRYAWEHFPSERTIQHKSGDMIYYPDNLSEIMAWTDAFVDRIALLTTQAEKNNATQLEDLRNQLTAANDKLKSTETDLTAANELAKKEKTRADGLAEDVQKLNVENEQLKLENQWLRAELEIDDDNIGEQQKLVQRLREELLQSEKERKDTQHNYMQERTHLLNEKKRLEEELAQAKGALAQLEKAHAQDTETLKTVQHLLMESKAYAEKLAKDNKKLVKDLDDEHKAHAQDAETLKKVQHLLMETKAYGEKLAKDNKKLAQDLDDERKAHTKDTETLKTVQHLLMETKAYGEKLAKDNQKLVQDLDDERKAHTKDTETLKTVQHLLIEAKAYSDKLANDLAEERKAHAQDIETLKTVRSDLAKAEAALAQLEKDYKEVQRSFITMKNLSEELRKENEKLKEDLDNERKAHAQDVETLKTVQHSLIEAKAYSDKLAVKILELSKEIDKIKMELNTASKLAERTQKMNDETAADLLQHLKTYDQSAIPPHPGFEKSAIRIISVVRGLKEYTWTQDKQVFKNLYGAAAAKDGSFHVNAAFFDEHNPHNKGKGCAITYQVVKGLVYTIIGAEGSTLKFKNLPAQ